MPDKDPITENMRIWDQVCETPQEVRKPFTRDGKELTGVTPMYYFQMATKMWGPIGEGWGFEVIDDRLIHDSKGQPVLHVVMVKLRHGGPGERALFAHGVGCTQMQYVDAQGKSHWDDDFNKKTLTDAITNALSRLGFGADIRLKSHEGSKYVGPAGAQGGKEDPEMTAAWNEYITWAREAYPDVAKTMSDMELCARAAKKLEDAQRRITPENVRSLMIVPTMPSNT